MPRALLLAACLLLVNLLAPASARELRMAYDTGPATFDIQERLTNRVLQLSHWCFDPLIRWNRDLEFEPRLATSFERIDDSTVRFRLRPGVRFHSGNALTAADVKWSFDRLRQSYDFRDIFASVIALEVIDDHSFDLVTDGPYPLLLHAAAHIFPMDSMYYSGTDANGRSKSANVKNGDTFASANLSGTGPFRLVAQESGAALVFERFDGYWDKHSPGNVSRLVFTPIPDEQARLDALLSGRVDLIAPLSPDAFDRVRAAPDVDLTTATGTRILSLQMNQQRRPEFRDQRVRMAIVHAIDNRAIVSGTMEGFATAAGQLSPPGYPGHNPSLEPRFDLELARRLMRDAGYREGFEITLMTPENRYLNDARIAREVAEMLARINIRVTVQTLPNDEYWPLFDDRAADMMMIGWRSDTEDSASLYEYLVMTPDGPSGFGSYNSGHYSNDFVDTQIAKARQETDAASRARMLQAIEARLFQDAAFVPLHWENLAWASRKNIDLAPVVNALDLPYLGDLVLR